MGKSSQSRTGSVIERQRKAGYEPGSVAERQRREGYAPGSVVERQRQAGNPPGSVVERLRREGKLMESIRSTAALILPNFVHRSNGMLQMARHGSAVERAIRRGNPPGSTVERARRAGNPPGSAVERARQAGNPPGSTVERAKREGRFMSAVVNAAALILPNLTERDNLTPDASVLERSNAASPVLGSLALGPRPQLAL